MIIIKHINTIQLEKLDSPNSILYITLNIVNPITKNEETNLVIKLFVE